MARATRPAAAQPPNIYITETDHQRLSVLVGSSGSPSPGATLLREELDRAIILGPADAPGRFVKLESTVSYEDCVTGRIRKVRLVLPEAADIDENRISVLTPVGAALLGLREGDTFDLQPGDGRPRTLRVVELAFDFASA